MGLMRRSNPSILLGYERRLEKFARELIQELYNNYAGLKSSVEIARIYKRHHRLFSPGTINELSKYKDSSRRARLLLDFVVTQYFENISRENTEIILSHETQSTVEYDGKIIPCRAIPALLANEGDMDKRHALSESRIARRSEINSLKLEYFSKLNACAREIGFKDYVGVYEEIRRLCLPDLTQIIRPFLQRTEAIYFHMLRKYLAANSVPPDQARPCDMLFLFRGPQFDRYFRVERLKPVIRSTLGGLGIDVEQQANITLDVENRPLKIPRSFCAPVRIPSEIILVLAPRGGLNDFRSALHELGHAQHYAHTDHKLSFAYKYCGDTAVTEAYAFLFDNLPFNRHWLERELNFDEPTKYLKLFQFRLLYMLRYLAVEVLYEQELYRSPNISKMGKRYADLFGAYMGIHFDERDYLADIDKGFYCISYLRAMALASQLQQYLERNYGEKWFNNLKAGEFLKSLWKSGLKYDAIELARNLGFRGIDFELVIEKITGGLSA